MMFLFYSDLHLRPERLKDCELVLNEVYAAAKVLRKRGDVTIINGGDTFNTRGVIKTSCLDVLQHHYRKWADDGFKQIILVGNHDQEDKAGDIHPMRVFDGLRNVTVVDKPTIFADLDLMAFPYMEKDLIEGAVKAAPRASYAVCHWGIKGARRNGGNVDDIGVAPEILKRFDKVFCGHYHYRNSFANIQYIGSPMQQNFGEMDQEKGILVFDTKTKKQTFIELTSPPKHHEVQIHWDGKKEEVLKSDKIGENDFVRVRVFGDAERCAAVDHAYIQKRVPKGQIKIERIVSERSTSRLEIGEAEILSPEILAEKYVDFLSLDLDKKRLLKIGKEIMA